MSTVSNFESGIGNAEPDSSSKLTVPDKQGKQWKVNYHLKDDELFESVLNKLVELFSPICDNYIFGEEYGTFKDINDPRYGQSKKGHPEQTRHIEGGIICKSDRMRRSAILNIFKFSDCQKSTGSVKTRAYKWNKLAGYCAKECYDVRANFKPPRALQIIPIDILRKEQREIVEQFRKPCPPIWEARGLLYWFWERRGGWGKSVVSLWMIDHLDAFVVSGANKDILFGFKQQVDEGKTPNIIVFDIPRCNENHVSYQAIESIKNGFMYSPKYEGGMCRFNPPHVICFSNEPPDTDEMSIDRWRIVELKKKVKDNRK